MDNLISGYSVKLAVTQSITFTGVPAVEMHTHKKAATTSHELEPPFRPISG